MNGNKKTLSVFLALLAAGLYALNVPLSKQISEATEPAVLAGFLYFGAGVGMGIWMLCGKAAGKRRTAPPLEKADLPYVIAMVVLDIAAPIFLMMGIARTSSANVSLLNNFEIVATTLIAFLVFRERVSKRLALGILLVVLASVILGFEKDGLTLNQGSLFVILASVCWGVENNCTRKISGKSSDEIVLIKGLFSGAGSLIVALLLGNGFPSALLILLTMLLGFVSYGMSIKFYVMAQHDLGASKTSAFYAVAPFLGVGFSFLFLGEKPPLQFYIALSVMAISTLVIVHDTVRGRES